MLLLTTQSLLMLLLILAAAQLFTNALEHLGARLQISEGLTGSLFAAVGTALPETVLPMLALFGHTDPSPMQTDIGVGAILGAPLMLSTLSSFLMAAAVLRQRGWRGRLQPELAGLQRDLHFFLGAFSLAGAAMLLPEQARTLRTAVGLILILLYFIYALLTLQASTALVASGHGTRAPERLLLARLGLRPNLAAICAQLGAATALLLLGAHGFIGAVEGVASALGVSALLLAVVVVPIATELPEKVNSILWARRGKDTLAMGNISGALVLQGTLLPAMGILATSWVARREVLISVLISLAAAAWLRWHLRADGLALRALLVNGLLYLVYLGLSLS